MAAQSEKTDSAGTVQIGIDVGGTHTDAVAVDHAGQVCATAKTDTHHDDLLCSVRTVFELLYKDILSCPVKGPVRPIRLTLSTTLATNALIQGKADPVGVFVSSGPGIDPVTFSTDSHYFTLDGSIDHRGEEIAPISDPVLQESIQAARAAGLRCFAAVSKFSTRNPAHEQHIATTIRENISADTITQGHRMGGKPNFGRRVTTAWYNAAVWRTFNTFADAIEESLHAQNLTLPVDILKADGGTMPLSLCRKLPVESILSGPSASIMGIMGILQANSKTASCPEEDFFTLDIGGTTTDIALFTAGQPVVEPAGLTVHGRPTLIRAMQTCSIGIGGDSCLWEEQGVLRVGPDRAGPPLCLGGPQPALMDACNILHMGPSGQPVGNRDLSVQGTKDIAARCALSVEAFARQALDCAVDRIHHAVDAMLAHVNARPVYTLEELLHQRTLAPTRGYVVGTPARVLQPALEKAFGHTMTVPRHHDVANALGAALARPTPALELFADTHRGTLRIPAWGISKSLPARSGGSGGSARSVGPAGPAEYDKVQALGEAQKHLLRALHDDFQSTLHATDSIPLDITHLQEFTMMDGFSAIGKQIRLTMQVRPGIR